MTYRVSDITTYDGDVAYVAKHMRAHDVAELRALSMSTPEEALRSGINISQECYLGKWNGLPMAVFGVHTNTLSGVGVPWLLGTDLITKHPTGFVKLGRDYVAHLRRGHYLLQNVVHDDNGPAKAFLRRVGFTLTEPHRVATGAMARTFTMEGFADV